MSPLPQFALKGMHSPDTHNKVVLCKAMSRFTHSKRLLAMLARALWRQDQILFLYGEVEC